MSRLCNATLSDLPGTVTRPGYDRTALQTGIVHLGLGAFHRAHQAVYTEHVLAAGDLRWGIAAASLRNPATRDALAPQNGLYTVNTRGESDSLAVIGSVHQSLVAPESPAALLTVMSAPATAIVSLTVTEKAYCRDAATGLLDESHPDILHDLANPTLPRSALGFLAAAIARRRSLGLRPFTILCCDNLPSNGATVHRLLARFAALQSPDLGSFITGEIASPDTMVDRIVPATTPEDRARVGSVLGLDDAWPVIAEPFTQWIIEDRFPAGRPAWEQAGATMVADVAPFEAMKLRLLNASHSALAYLGYLAGEETIASAMRDPGLAAFAAAVM
ncbi:mannitol dehydrogenase family protein, partial [Acidisphaera sp. L21]|uniref:mannitol dehydrogenase family protein n=1 Tax=Acidisphaera sp. L21 TaxID=1641851 RepID=UPI00131C560C